MSTFPRWEALKVRARKLLPSRAARWGLIYLPLFTVATLFALRAFGAMEDLVAYALELAPKSMHLMVGIALAYAVSCGLGWNLDNDKRADYQRLLIASGFKHFGAFLVLAGEMLAILSLYWITLRALTVWQG